MADRLERLAELAVHGANVQPGQVLMVTGEIGNEDVARAVAAAGYRRGAKFVDVDYFDPHVKRARIEHADPDTLDFVPPWYGTKMLEHAEDEGARVTLATLTAPNLLDDLDKKLVGRDMLPRVKELTKIVGDRSTNWCIVPAPHRAWAALVYPDLDEDAAYERLWDELEHVLRLDDGDRGERMGRAHGGAERRSEPHDRARVRRDRAARAGNRALDRHAADAPLVGGRLHARRRPAPPSEPSDRRSVHDAGPAAHERSRHVDEAACAARRHDRARPSRALRERHAVEIDADANADALSSLLEIDQGALRLGELALVDRKGRIGPLGTVFYNTLLDENAASHIALGAGFKFLVDEDDRAARQRERPAHRLHDRLERDRRGRRHRGRRARARPARRRLADLSAQDGSPTCE